MFVYLAWLNACDKQTSYEICEIIASDKTFHMVRYFFFLFDFGLDVWPTFEKTNIVYNF